MTSNRDLLDALLRTDFPSFVAKSFATVSGGQHFLHNWHIEAIAYELDLIMTGKNTRLLITMPPRSLKSICASGRFRPLRLAGIRQSGLSAYLTPKILPPSMHATVALSWKATGIETPRTRISRSKSADLDFETTKRGGRLSASVGGSLTGRGGSLIIIDDPQKPIDALSDKRRAGMHDWFRNTLSSRLDDKRGDAIIVVMPRLHTDDLAGQLIATGLWRHLNLPALAIEPEEILLPNGRIHCRQPGEPLHAVREPASVLKELQASMGTFHFSAQYQQSPIPVEGNLVKSCWFRRYDIVPVKRNNSRLIQSWDLAVKEGEENDWSVCITAAASGKSVHVLDIFRQRLDYPAQRKAVIRLARATKPM